MARHYTELNEQDLNKGRASYTRPSPNLLLLARTVVWYILATTQAIKVHLEIAQLHSCGHRLPLPLCLILS